MILTRALFHQLQGFFERILFVERQWCCGLGQIVRPGVSTRLRTAFSACKSACNSGLILFSIVAFSFRFRGHDGAPKV
jgi:hypothetical protein